MTPREAVALATVVQAYFPSQPISEFTPDALHELLEPYTLADCKTAIQARALRLINTEGVKWCAPTDVYAEVRRMRAKAIATDMSSLELPPHNPDDPQDYIRALRESQAASLAGNPIQPQGLVRRNIAELGGPVRRVNELEDNDRRTYAERAKAANAAARIELAAKPDPEREPAAVFACEHRDDDTPCGRPAPHLSADRRRPVCGEHVEPDLEESA